MVLDDSSLELLPELLHGVVGVLVLLGSGSSRGDDSRGGSAGDGGGVCGNHFDVW